MNPSFLFFFSNFSTTLQHSDVFICDSRDKNESRHTIIIIFKKENGVLPILILSQGLNRTMEIYAARKNVTCKSTLDKISNGAVGAGYKVQTKEKKKRMKKFGALSVFEN